MNNTSPHSKLNWPSQIEAISENCRRLSIPSPREATDKLSAYVTEICRWNKRINLTGAANPVAFVNGPLFDAMTLIPVLAPGRDLIDIGSGGGLPGIPALILTGQQNTTLVEPRAKRASFLRHILHELDLVAEVRTTRIEALSNERWSGAVAQAVFEPKEWVERARDIVTPDGAIYVLTSTPLASTLPEGIAEEARFDIRNPHSGTDRFAIRLRRQYPLCHAPNR